jgi:hypothetical protein
MIPGEIKSAYHIPPRVSRVILNEARAKDPVK